MIVSVATRSQLKTPSETLKSVRGPVAHDEPNTRHKQPTDNTWAITVAFIIWFGGFGIYIVASNSF